MRLTLTRTGGIGGLRQTLALDAGLLTEGEREELARLVAAAGLWSAPARLAARTPAPDRLRYRLAVEDGPRRRELRADEEALPAPLLRLVRWVEERAVPTPAPRPKRG
jgi:hypothetical protein